MVVLEYWCVLEPYYYEQADVLSTNHIFEYVFGSMVLIIMFSGAHRISKPVLPKLSLLHMNVAEALEEALAAMDAADEAHVHGDAPVIEDGDDEPEGEAGHLPDAAGDGAPPPDAADDGAQAVPAGEVVPDADLQPLQLAAAGLETLQQRAMRYRLAETVAAAFGRRGRVRMDGMMLQQEEIQRHSVSLHRAPPIFRERYDAQQDYTWATFGFNLILNSFYPGGVRNQQSIMLAASASVEK